MSGPGARTVERGERGGRARRTGRTAEVLAAFWLMARGYRVLGFRTVVQGVEVDLVVRRRGVLAVVEVKRRRTIEEALEAVRPDQRERLARAARALAVRNLATAARLDLLALAPGRLPLHLPDAWSGQAEGRPWS